MQKGLFVGIVCLLICVGCNNLKQEVSVVYKATVMPVIGTESLRCPGALVFFENYLAIVHQCGANRLQIFDMTDFSDQWLGEVGGGPNEIWSLGHLPSFARNNAHQIKFVDDAKKRFFHLIRNDQNFFSLEAENAIPNQLEGYLECVELTDHSLIYGQSNGLYNLGRYFPDGRELFLEDFYPDIGSTHTGVKKAYDYYHSLLVHPSGNIIVQALQGAPFLVAFDDQLQLKDIKQTKNTFTRLDAGDFGPGGSSPKQYVLEAHSNTDYIYLLNPQASFDETSDGNFIPSIEIYDWELNQVATLTLDRLFVYMAIDYQNQKIYGATMEDAEIILGFVEIPEALKAFFPTQNE
jgi:hypothetical protein